MPLHEPCGESFIHPARFPYAMFDACQVLLRLALQELAVCMRSALV